MPIAEYNTIFDHFAILVMKSLRLSLISFFFFSNASGLFFFFCVMPLYLEQVQCHKKNCMNVLYKGQFFICCHFLETFFFSALSQQGAACKFNNVHRNLFPSPVYQHLRAGRPRPYLDKNKKAP
jgi:hypothetical protein